MSLSQPPSAPRQPPQILRSLALFACLLLGLFGVGAAVVAAMLLVSGPGPDETWQEALPSFAGIALFAAACLFGAFKLYPYASRPANFAPGYAPVSPDVAGFPLSVRYQRTGWSRTLMGRSAVRFDGEVLVVEGTLMPPALLQLGVVAAVTLIPLAIFHVGLGIIPALVVGRLLGQRKVAQRIPYAELQDVAVRGLVVSFRHPGAVPERVAFSVANADGERLYRELGRHLPHVAATLGRVEPR